MAELRILLLAGLLSLPSITLAEERLKVDSVVECLNEKITLSDEPRISRTEGPVARVLEPDDFRNICTAQHYFCVVSAEVSWMFTWNMVLKAGDSRILAFDLWPEPITGFTKTSINHVYVPLHVAEAVSACGTEWKGHWEGEPLFYVPEPRPELGTTSTGFAGRAWNGEIEDLLPPSQR